MTGDLDIKAVVLQRHIRAEMLPSDGHDQRVHAGFQVGRIARSMISDLADGASRKDRSIDWPSLVVSASPAHDGTAGIVLTARAGLKPGGSGVATGTAPGAMQGTGFESAGS
jgi:hypothetical protein